MEKAIIFKEKGTFTFNNKEYFSKGNYHYTRDVFTGKVVAISRRMYSIARVNWIKMGRASE